MILDGWGITQDPKVSAIYYANTPYIILYTTISKRILRQMENMWLQKTNGIELPHDRCDVTIRDIRVADSV